MDQDMPPNVNKTNMEGTMETIATYLRSQCGVKRAPLAYIIMKTVVVETHGIYLCYATPDD